MKIILLRFEKETLNLLECDIDSGNIVIGKKEKISLESVNNDGEKYNKILDELSHIPPAYTPDIYAYQPAPPNMRGVVDKIRYANEAMLNLYCYQNNFQILKLTKPNVRKNLSITQPEFKKLLEQEAKDALGSYSLAKSNKLFDGFVLLALLKKTF